MLRSGGGLEIKRRTLGIYIEYPPVFEFVEQCPTLHPHQLAITTEIRRGRFEFASTPTIFIVFLINIVGPVLWQGL